MGVTVDWSIIVGVVASLGSIAAAVVAGIGLQRSSRKENRDEARAAREQDRAELKAFQDETRAAREQDRAELKAFQDETRAAREQDRAELRAFQDETRADLKAYRDEAHTELKAYRDEAHTELKAYQEEARVAHAEIGNNIERLGARLEAKIDALATDLTAVRVDVAALKATSTQIERRLEMLENRAD
jgi:hypothetical protein